MIRRLNYTGRKRIRREDARIALLDANAEGSRTFAADLSLARYQLPPDAVVFIEAYRQTTWRRFHFGRVSALEPPTDCSLRAFGSGEGVRFRVKIVEKRDDGEATLPAVILAGADQIRPQQETKGKAATESLLAVEWGNDEEYRHIPYRLEFGEDAEPLLRVSSYQVTDRDAFVRSPEFICLVAPELFRAILVRILLVDQYDVHEGAEEWQMLWIRLARELPDMSVMPSRDDAAALDDWIDVAVSAFAKRIDLRIRFAKWWTEEAPK